MIVADTGAVLALIDADDHHHASVRRLFEHHAAEWLLPWAILPEVDYLLAEHVGQRAEHAFLADLAEGMYLVEWGNEADLARAHALSSKYRSLGLGLVDGIVAATAERLGARAVATLDLRHFGAIKIKGNPKLFPRDL